MGITALILCASTSQAHGLTSSSVLADTRRAADWQLENLPADPRTGWKQGVLLGGVMSLDGVSPGGGYRSAAKEMSEANRWRLGSRKYFADDHCIGQTYLELYSLSRASAMLDPTKSRLDWVIDHPNEGSLAFTSSGSRTRWSWSDALYMAPPTWTRLYRVTGGIRYRDFLIKHWLVTSRYLFDTGEHLYYRDSRFFAAREANGEKVFWSRGNGWVIAGLVRVLQYLPSNDPAYGRLVDRFQQLAPRIASCQGSDGLWRTSLLDPSSYPSPESSGSALFCYALAWGVNQGLLDPARYEPIITSAWEGLTGCLAPDGRLTRVQPPDVGPALFDADNSDRYGTGAFLLAGSEMYRWALSHEKSVAAVTFTNTMGRRRRGVSVRVPIATLEAALPGLDLQSVALMNSATSRFVAWKVDQGDLVFRISVLPYETRKYLVFASQSPTPGLAHLGTPRIRPRRSRPRLW